MKTNQKIFLTLVFSCVLLSCTNNETVATSTDASTDSSTYEVISAAALPSTITSYIASKYAGSTTTEVNLNSDGTYDTYVTLASGTSAKTSSVVAKLSFTTKGTLASKLTVTSIAIADLLPAITTYISTNYAGATTIAVHSESDGSFDVIIVAADGSKIKLNFASDGAFVSSKTLKTRGNHNHNHADKQTAVAIADLTTSIKTYISTNYSGATITSAHKESDGTFDVLITTADGANLNLNFSATGEFVSVSSNGNNRSNRETSIAIADLLADIKTYIATNYVGSTITSAKKDWNSGFEVHLTTVAGVKLELNFTSTGVFVVGSDSNNNHSSSTMSVVVSDLIANIKTYVTTNYAGATITEAHLESDGSYDVKITTATGSKLKLYFTSAGVFISSKKA